MPHIISTGDNCIDGSTCPLSSGRVEPEVPLQADHPDWATGEERYATTPNQRAPYAYAIWKTEQGEMAGTLQILTSGEFKTQREKRRGQRRAWKNECG